ncbi:DUF1513 domain-containing protein [Primorskyibacter sp. S187A]|uniref:DUF1513 domain-containing protein n=1 Tax=Primorskyibacter sp. S187A TaxID=3415130 RepID=UPI003C7D507F
MQAGRRQFIAGLLATGLAPTPSWADVGSPAFLSAAALSDGRYALCGIDDALNITFQRPLPARGHAAAAHPTRPEAVAFARRPGTFACVVDCTTGVQKAMLKAPEGRHFYGHGAFSEEGSLLYTTENDYEAGRGCIGVWDVAAGYARIDEWDSGGIGPHDIRRLPGTDRLVVANGGIDTHPASGRTKLNIATMTPNLTYIEQGRIAQTVALPPAMHRNSIRHLALSQGGDVACGMQWQGEGTPPGLVAHHRFGGQLNILRAAPDEHRTMRGYIGSLAFSEDNKTIAATSPRGGLVQFYDVASSRLVGTHSLPDVCGIAPAKGGFLLTSGTGHLVHLASAGEQVIRQGGVRWDNHLVVI